ncbi:AcrR family transcriptional regulator [Pseudomonas sp. TE6288]|uniref:TetR/AcrR family transcriptional regulator n=1 Tax=Pseudomonas TaxID=286 RepID=UPI00111B7150|nr:MULTISPECIES: TetR/AcrR family transcriptional regulator [Pseudomonas]MBI6952713.1 TetR/AcrR family transcriptional regulator [Pseudomonas sp. CCOS 191]MDF9756560.1 AcrR family transcriptional regulator [Pseudomonas hunanensis]UVL17190.1 TetR/AcrR family transcriptional regulator [Pseudomonas sp. B21-044]UVM14540.1 TetR/AcrR family transcriptional regulator [Pseudomonas sp. B21-023]
MPTPRRSRAAMSADTTERLIAVARRQFAEKGFAAVVMDELCAEADLTRGALHHHFGGKAGLFTAVVQHLLDEINQAIDARYATHADPWEGYIDTCLYYYDLLHEPALRRILLQDAPGVLGPRLREMEEASYIGPMAQGLVELQQAGRLRAFDAVAMAHLLNGAMGDSGIWVIAQDDPQAAAERVKGALRCVLEGLQA